MDRNKILIVVIIILVGSSVAMLYKVYNRDFLSFSLVDPTQVTDEDVRIRDETNKIEARIKSTMFQLKSAGTLDKIIGASQFKELNSRSVVSVELPTQTDDEYYKPYDPSAAPTAGRNNPFDPIKYQQTDGMVEERTNGVTEAGMPFFVPEFDF